MMTPTVWPLKHLTAPLRLGKRGEVMDSKWRFCLRLKRFYRTCFIADGRVSAQYKRGWNDAVASLMASIGTLYRRQEPFLKTLLENSRQASVRVVAGGLEFRNHIAGLLPETWYADLPVENRIQLLAEQWQRLQRICEAQLTRIAELEAERSVLRQQFHSEAEQRQFLGDLIDNMPHAQIAAELTEFKAKVAAALEELRAKISGELLGDDGCEYNEAISDSLRYVDAIITKLGLAPGKDGSK